MKKKYNSKNNSRLSNIERSHNFKFTKSLGQNFLRSDSIIEEIVSGAEINEEDLVIEIGPGSGALTELISNRAGKVIAIELDKEVIPVLKEVLGSRDNVEILNEDVLDIDLSLLIENAKMSDDSIKNVKIIGNLPYYITTPIIMKILKEGVPAVSITCMIQKEVAERINAKVGTKEYGALSIAVNYFCVVNKICDVSREMFMPVPKVDSTVLRLDIREKKAVKVESENIFFSLVKTGFGKRRKTLQNSLIGYRGMSKEEVTKLLESSGIDYQRRAESLTMEDFAKMATIMSRKEQI